MKDIQLQAFQPPHVLPEIKQAVVQKQNTNNNNSGIRSTSVSNGYSPILLDSDDDDDDDDDWDIEGSPEKKAKILAALPVGFLDPLKPEERLAMQLPVLRNGINNKNNGTFNASLTLDGERDFDIKSIKKEEPLLSLVEANGMSRGHLSTKKSCNVKQFWKAGDYDGARAGSAADAPSEAQSAGLDHVRVHPKFLHSNATSHKWALGAFAELLDNSLDEVSNGATYVHVDMLKNKKYQNAMLMVEDNGGGMTPDKIRQCMSLGYSAKSKLANTIGQYGNGFKTSTMRLGADVIVFSRCRGKYKGSSTQSIGMLSYSFLTETGKEDTVVPMIDYEKRGEAWKMMMRYTPEDWKRNLELIVDWSPYESEEDLLQQFDSLKDQGTRIILYNLWEDDQGLPELDFDADKHDIQIRGVNRDEKKIQMAKSFPNLRHYLTYRHSLRNYAAILYLRIPPRFRIILRGKSVDHYKIMNDLIHSKVITYRPQGFPEEAPKDPNLVAVLHIGFIKDANYHLDVQGFNVYHKNRLIKPFWRVWNAAGSDGRGVIGILEANFVQPAHDKQGFERTIVFSRLEARLIAIQKNFWSTNCHKVGYAQRVNLKNSVSHSNSRGQGSRDGKLSLRTNSKNDHRSPVEDGMRKAQNWTPATQPQRVTNCEDKLIVPFDDSNAEIKLKEENDELRASLEDVLQEVQLEKDRNKSLEHDLREERNERGLTEEALRNKLEVASNVIQELSDKVKSLERLLRKREK